MMSDLPSSRISPAPPFMRCGVDYAGPFEIKIIKETTDYMQNELFPSELNLIDCQGETSVLQAVDGSAELSCFVPAAELSCSFLLLS
ncbi:hypothetical protein TNCV_1493521 [Trichonephila clavipes]|nr:hypothetical protein TNCV_1493521 [Trichonephila clavipes]